MGRVISGIFDGLCVRALKGKQLKLLTRNLVDIMCMAFARRALTPMSKGQRLRSHGYQMHY